MTGKVLVIVLLLCGAAAGAAMYYFQVYGFYYEVAARPGQDVALMPLGGDAPRPIAYDGFQAIDADSSPIRYRACFTTDLSLDALSAAYEPVEAPEPLTAPTWFGCYDAAAIDAALKAGTARAYLGAKNIHYGVDRIVTVTEEGRGYVWHVLNNCGKKAYDGTVVGEECPPRPEN
ncbi:histidine kinase [Ruegeria pomeroyi]|jgi:hypothetical protein|uniref:Signal transduction n=2 Tax=Ruegeria pomeroyi TaxID=89184 RepID=V5UZD3_RUEPO|nr:DUF6446 family protein [Ruegeria pomeroyi]AHB86020.1 Signal transduction [Ruegeria pomeroyi DSS-3]NVK98488.1 histidine kinase [Ruegeria pomeroyi]NVL03314.1 histidine kinase [Ruegeria pomeroyi]QWV08226.1 histidine kinase [Ruegeria pomeroyi]